MDLPSALLKSGIPVVVVSPGEHYPPGWQQLTAAECDLSGFRPGVDALAMVGGHGLDAIDVDPKSGGSVDALPAFKSFGVTRTPSGGSHFIVPSSGIGKITGFRTELGHVGDYVGGRPDGTGRMLLFLPGSVRSKYGDVAYVEEVPWDLAACLAAEPDPALVAALEAAGGSRRERPDKHVDDSPLRDPELGPHPYAQAVVAAELDRLTECDVLGWDGPHWDATTFAVACNLIEIGNSAWSGYELDDLEEAFLLHAPADEGFTAANHAAKWASALIKTDGGARRNPVDTPSDDFGSADVLSSFFDQTPLLSLIRNAAHSKLVGAPSLLAYVLARVLAEAPITSTLPATIGATASLNLGFAIVGDSGSGKSSLQKVSRDLLGLVGLGQSSIERNVGSGEGMVMLFLKWDSAAREHRLVHDPRRIVTIDEIDQLGATQNRTGSTLAPTIRSAMSGSSLGQSNATAERTRHVPADSYRLVMLLGVQPARSGLLLDDADVGTPQRLLWVEAVDPTIPEEPVSWPGALNWTPPDVPATLDYPDPIKSEIRAARLVQLKTGSNPLASHKYLTRLKVAAALALLHGESQITYQWWGLAEQLVDASMAVQIGCKRALAEASVQAHRSAGRADAFRREGAARYWDERVDKAAETILRQITRHAEGAKDGVNQKHGSEEGCTARCITRALKNFADRDELRAPALERLCDDDEIVQKGDRWRAR